MDIWKEREKEKGILTDGQMGQMSEEFNFDELIDVEMEGSVENSGVKGGK